MGVISDWLNQQDTGGYSTSPPLTQTASSHSVSIKTDKGIKIGRIQSWAPQLARTVDTLYEVHKYNRGEPIERVPQAQTGNSISIERYELYTYHLGQAFGVPLLGDNTDLSNLTLQLKPINVREIWRDPYGGTRAYMYYGCWFSNLGITISANDDRIIKCRATLEFTRKITIA